MLASGEAEVLIETKSIDGKTIVYPTTIFYTNQSSPLILVQKSFIMLFSIILVCILNPEFGAVINEVNKTLSLALPKFSVNILFEFL